MQKLQAWLRKLFSKCLTLAKSTNVARDQNYTDINHKRFIVFVCFKEAAKGYETGLFATDGRGNSRNYPIKEQRKCYRTYKSAFGGVIVFNFEMYKTLWKVNLYLNGRIVYCEREGCIVTKSGVLLQCLLVCQQPVTWQKEAQIVQWVKLSV